MFDIIIAVIASQFVGVFWYSPILAGKQWMGTAFPGCSIEEINSRLSGKIIYVIGFLSSVFLALLLKFYLLQSVATVGGAAHVAILLGGFSAILEVCHYGFEGRPWKLFIIDHLHNFFNILVISCLLVVF